MASSSKRLKLDDGSDDGSSLQDFLQWCDRVGLKLNHNKVYVSDKGTLADYGMLAKEDIEEGEVLFTVPRSVLLHQGTSKVSAVLEQGKESLESSSGWVPLLLALLYEYTCRESHWAPYLSLWTDFSSLDQPLFWSREERETLLRGTGVLEAVERDLANMQAEYSAVVLPFMARHPTLWNPSTHTLELYTRLVAFVMAYSFQEPQEEDEEADDDDDEEEEEEKAPNLLMMVPMADMLNHVSNHNAILEFTAESLEMVCVRPVLKGQEVFNSYGQLANWQLLHMYGFTEPHPTNLHDTADVPMANVFTAATQGVQSEPDHQLLEEKRAMILETMGEKAAFIFGEQGCLTDTELHTTLKVLGMSREEFQEFRENEGWEEDEEADEEKVSLAFSNEGLPGLKASWRCLVHAAVRLTLDGYRSEEGGDDALMQDPVQRAALHPRQQRALQVRYGQKSILTRVLALTKS